MCVAGRSKLCLICLLLYTLLPSFTVGTSVQNGTKTSTYSQAETQTDPGHEEAELLQLKETIPEIFEKDYYINQLMIKYGNGTGMTFEGFEHLLHKLGLGNIVTFDHSTDCHKPTDNSSFKSFHDSHNHSKLSDSHKSSNFPCENKTDHSQSDHSDDNHSHDDHDHSHNDHDHSHDDHDHSHDDHDHSNDEHENKDATHQAENTLETKNGTANISTKTHSEHDETGDHEHDHDHIHSKRSISSQENKCLTAELFLHISESHDLQYLSKDKFYELCPSLIYQISTDSCHDYHEDDVHSHSNHQVDSHDDHGHDHDHDHDHDLVTSESLTTVPSKVWGFSTIAVVIISLVGLLGVAVIPIMQKVFYNHMLQFLVALAVGALTGDALLHLLPHAMSGGHGGGHDDHGDHGDHGDLVYKGLLGLLGIYFFFITERVLTIFTDQKRRKKQKKNMKYRGSLDKVGEKLAAAECDEMMMSVHPNKALQGYVDEAHSEHCTISFENSSTISHQHGKHKNHNENHSHNHNDINESDNEEHVDMLTTPSGSHGHGHSHCVDGAPNSIAAVAWMVILGDGIHNFSDGLAIGAAFSNSITGGFSTSIAVFCHELPHEIGDFAMLLRAGMAPKQAIIYNCLSSILCFVGMLIGVAIGNIENASLWIFAVVGGMFLYIALVDMLPEMSSVDTKRGENPYCHLILQIVGMSMGASMMLIIALYEEELKSILD